MSAWGIVDFAWFSAGCPLIPLLIENHAGGAVAYQNKKGYADPITLVGRVVGVLRGIGAALGV